MAQKITYAELVQQETQAFIEFVEYRAQRTFHPEVSAWMKRLTDILEIEKRIDRTSQDYAHALNIRILSKINSPPLIQPPLQSKDAFEGSLKVFEAVREYARSWGWVRDRLIFVPVGLPAWRGDHIYTDITEMDRQVPNKKYHGFTCPRCERHGFRTSGNRGICGSPIKSALTEQWIPCNFTWDRKDSATGLQTEEEKIVIYFMSRKEWEDSYDAFYTPVPDQS